MADGVSTTDAAERLGTTRPTIRSLLERGVLAGTQMPRGGKRTAWIVDSDSLDEFVARHGRFDQKTQQRTGPRLAKLEADVAALRAILSEASIGGPGFERDAIARERDDLRARVVTLEEALARSRTAAELQRRAEAARAQSVEHLLAAVAAGERADALRREALAEMDDAVAAASRVGYLGDPP
jgi:excisionase family DNA binding protein